METVTEFILRGSKITADGDLSHETQRDGTGRDEGGGFRMGTCVYLWRIHVDVWQNQYNIVK